MQRESIVIGQKDFLWIYKFWPLKGIQCKIKTFSGANVSDIFLWVSFMYSVYVCCCFHWCCSYYCRFHRFNFWNSLNNFRIISTCWKLPVFHLNPVVQPSRQCYQKFNLLNFYYYFYGYFECACVCVCIFEPNQVTKFIAL